MTEVAIEGVIEGVLSVRPMRAGDLAQVAGLEAQIYEFPWSLGNFKDSLAAGYSCWVLSDLNAIVGYAVVMIGVEEAHLLNLSVVKSYQRQGLGKRLMQHLTEVANECEAKRFLLEVRQSNTVAREFYAVHGFTTLGVRRDYYPAEVGREDAVVMELML